MYQSHARRMALERVIALKNSLVAGIWSNTNYDKDKEHGDPRGEFLRNLDEWYDSAVAEIYGLKDEYEIDEDNPFFKAINVPKIEEMEMVDPQTLQELSG